MKKKSENDPQEPASEPEFTIEFAPGAFDNFEGTQEELDEMIAEIEQMVADGTLLENSQTLDLEELFLEDPGAATQVAYSLGMLDGLVDEFGNEVTKEDLEEMFDCELNDKKDGKNLN